MERSRVKLLKKHGVGVRVFEAFLEVLAKRYEGKVWPEASSIEEPRRTCTHTKRTLIVVGYEFQGRVVLSREGAKWAVRCLTCGKVKVITKGAIHNGKRCWCQVILERDCG